MSQPGRMRVGVLISGRGSNLQALLDACAEPGFPAEIVLVVSNTADAPGLSRAQGAGVATRVVPHRDYAGRAEFDAAMTAALEAARVELVCMAGFMRLVSGGFVARWRDRLINIHPSLLPLFPGLDTHARALAAGVKLHGCTVHVVRPEMDSGPIIGQAAVPVLRGDTADTLAARVLRAEHLLYPHCLRLFAEGRVAIRQGTGGEVAEISAPSADDDARLINPAPLVIS